MRHDFKHLGHAPGMAPGIEHDEIARLPGGNEPAHITCIDYCPDQLCVQEITCVEEFVAQHRPEWTAVRWICVDGMADAHAIEVLATKYDLHPLAVEDMLQ